MIIEIASATIIIIGVLFVLTSALGIVRLPDFYIRVSAITKAATLGVACIMVGVAIYFNEVDVALKAGAIFIFLLITSPIAAHIIGRAAYEDGVPLWKKTTFDEFRDYREGKLENEQNKSDRLGSDSKEEKSSES
ncbi:MAG: monovalent cation/H(+) antiporter subunit G [Saprospirales bacterium]|nr:MAG: monovalent cation/H(+) antiporter subunit G [Saprospirales bacterium]